MKKLVNRLFIIVLSLIGIIILSLTVPKSAVAAIYISNFNGTETTVGSDTIEYVDITVNNQGTIITRTATGAMTGQATFNIVKSVNIKTGTYAGWGYLIVNYNLAGYSGTIYRVHYNGNSQVWAIVTGDIHAVMNGFVNGKPRWYLTSIKGVQTSGIVDFVTTSNLPGTSADYNNIELRIHTGSVVQGTVSGYYNGPVQNSGFNLTLPIFQEGISIRTYQSNVGSGNIRLYRDLSSPTTNYSKGMRDGVLFGTVEVSGPKGGGGVGVPITGIWEHVIQTQTAVGYSPQWLIATIAILLLAGGYGLIRRQRA